MTTPILPTELIYEILSYTSPVDVVRWRTVSKQFCTITHEPALWKTLYANAHYLRPPGPFPTLSFERAFVRSAQLAQSWTTRHLRTVSRVSIPFDGQVEGNRLVGGRWLVVCQMRRRFVLYDTDPGADAETRAPRILWEQQEEIFRWDTYVRTSEQGQWVVYVLLGFGDFYRWRLLEFRLDAESGVLCDTVSVDAPAFDDCNSLCGGHTTSAHSPFLTFGCETMVFDTRTRTFYEFPKLCIALDTTRSWPIDPEGNDTRDILAIVPTNTHVFLLRDFSDAPAKSCTVIQAFTVPDDGGKAFRLSHEGIFFSDDWSFVVIRNSVVDPVTGAINVRLIGRHWVYHRLPATCVDLTLEKPSQDAVSPITINQHHTLVQRDELTDRHGLPFDDVYDIGVSDDGHARGLFTLSPHPTRTGTFDVVKFTIDATRDRCVVVLHRSSAAAWDVIMCPIPPPSRRSPVVALDGVRGRLCYVDEGPDGRAVVVVDVE